MICWWRERPREKRPSDEQALSTEGYEKASGLVLGDSSMEVKVTTTSRWKPSADRRVIVALKDFALVVAAAVSGGADGFGGWRCVSLSMFMTVNLVRVLCPPILTLRIVIDLCNY